MSLMSVLSIVRTARERLPHMNAITRQALSDFPALLEAHCAAIPDEFKHWAPPSWDGMPSETLTAIQQICHVRDIEVLGYHVRFSRTIDEDHPLLESLDTDALARDRSYERQSAEQVLSEFREARSRTMALIDSFSPDQLRRTAVAAEPGPRSLQPRSAASGGLAMACRQDRGRSCTGVGLTFRCEGAAGRAGRPSAPTLVVLGFGVGLSVHSLPAGNSNGEIAEPMRRVDGSRRFFLSGWRATRLGRRGASDGLHCSIEVGHASTLGVAAARGWAGLTRRTTPGHAHGQTAHVDGWGRGDMTTVSQEST